MIFLQLSIHGLVLNRLDVAPMVVLGNVLVAGVALEIATSVLFHVTVKTAKQKTTVLTPLDLIADTVDLAENRTMYKK